MPVLVAFVVFRFGKSWLGPSFCHGILSIKLIIRKNTIITSGTIKPRSANDGSAFFIISPWQDFNDIRIINHFEHIIPVDDFKMVALDGPHCASPAPWGTVGYVDDRSPERFPDCQFVSFLECHVLLRGLLLSYVRYLTPFRKVRQEYFCALRFFVAFGFDWGYCSECRGELVKLKLQQTIVVCENGAVFHGV